MSVHHQRAQAGVQSRNIEAETEAEAMEELTVLFPITWSACFLIQQNLLPKGSTTHLCIYVLINTYITIMIKE